MSKSTRPGLPFEKFLAIALASGLPVEEKASWVKVGPKHARMYFNKGETVRQVDLSGDWAESLTEGMLALRSPNGSVKCHLDLSDERCLAHFEMLCSLIVQTTAPQPKAKPEPKRVAKPAVKRTTEHVAQVSDARKKLLEARLAAREEARLIVEGA